MRHALPPPHRYTAGVLYTNPTIPCSVSYILPLPRPSRHRPQEHSDDRPRREISAARRTKHEAILALLTHRNVEAAAKSIGVAPTALFRWMQVPEFDAAYCKARRDAFKQSVGRLQQASGVAVTTLLKLAVDPNAPAAVRARAAYYILTLTAKAIEIDDIEKRVADLERAAELSKQTR
jgi:hypothetical protein